MLRISKKADYAVFLLGAIARQGAYPGGSAADTVVSAHEIARQAGLNKSVVANLLKEFSRHGMLESVRGLRGGYRLANPPSEVSLGQILEVVEGKFVLVDCVPHEPISFPPSNSASSSPASHSSISNDSASNDPASNSAPSNSATSNSANASKTTSSSTTSTSSSHDCSLIGFCPSKQPMRVVHHRINQLFAEIYLDELCSMTPVAHASSHSAPRTAARTIATASTGPVMAGTGLTGSNFTGSNSTGSNRAAGGTKNGN